MSKFDPKQHLIDLRGKKYLPVNMRLVWFREDHPTGSITTDVVNYAPLVVRANVYSGEGVLLATGHGSATIKQGATVVWSGREIEKAETAAIGRALGHAGFGTQFDNDDDDLDNLADSPIELVNLVNRQSAPKSQNTAPSSDLAQQNAPVVVDTQSDSKTPAERLGTPPGQTVAPRVSGTGFPMGDFKTRCLKEIYANDAIHMNKSLAKLIEAGLLNYDTMTLEQAFQVVQTRKEADVPA